MAGSRYYRLKVSIFGIAKGTRCYFLRWLDEDHTLMTMVIKKKWMKRNTLWITNILFTASPEEVNKI